MAKRIRGRKKGSQSGLFAQIKALVRSTIQESFSHAPSQADLRWFKKTTGADYNSSRPAPQSMSDKFAAAGANRLSANVQATSFEPPNRPPMHQGVAQSTGGAVRLFQRLYVPGASAGTPENQPPVHAEPERREFKPLTRNLGGSILRLGANVPVEVQRAALDAVNGTNLSGIKTEKQLQDFLREAKGVEKSGASALTRGLGAVRKKIHEAGQIGVLANVAQQGGVAGGLAQSELANIAVDKATNLFDRKVVEKMFTGIANKIAQDPLAGERLFRALGRGLRLGGVVATVVQLGFDTAQEFYAQRQASASSQMNTFTSADKAGVNPALARAERSRIRWAVENRRGIYRQAMDFWGFNAATEAEIEAEASKQYQGIAATRTNPALFGVDAARVVGELAAQKGVPIEGLTDYEKREAIDKAIRAKITVPDANVEAELKKRGFVRKTSKTVVFGMNGISYQESEDLENKRFIAAQKIKIEDEMKLEMINGALNEQARRIEASQRAIAAMPAEERARIQREVRESRMASQAYRNRHKVSWED